MQLNLISRRIAIWIGAAALSLTGLFMAGDRAEFGQWQTIGLATGTPDDSRTVDFANLVRRSSPNDALICPADVCPKAQADFDPPVFTVPADRLRERLHAAARGEARTSELGLGGPVDRLRFVQRSLLLGFPDVIDVLIVTRGSGASTVALYSRSLVGRRDFGVNRARIERWLAAISK